jgi:hypothetical protein
MANPVDMLHFWGVWISALLTLFIFTFLYKDNPLYKFAEHLFVGISAGYWFCYYFWSYLKPKLYDSLVKIPEDHFNIIYIIPLCLGIMMLMRLIPKVSWMSRWPISFIVGTFAGMNLINYLQTNVLDQIGPTIAPITGFNADSISNLILAIGVVTGIIYFFFSAEHKGAIGVTAKIGVWFLMVAFGASFGYTVMARISLLIGRMQFLIFDWIVYSKNLLTF